METTMAKEDFDQILISGAATASGGSATDMYSRAQIWGAGGPPAAGPVGGIPRTGPGNSTPKSGSEYDYSGYGSGYDYDHSNYIKVEPVPPYGAGPRSGYGINNSLQPQYPASQAV